MKSEVYIFDIDGCIMPNLFENYGWVKDQDRNQVIREVNEKGKNISLFPHFIKYFRIYCKDALKIYFITGRQKKEFSILTINQLKPLFQFQYDFTIVWYPPHNKHSSRKYFRWKVQNIDQIMQKHAKNGVFFMIFDDLIKYFSKIPRLEKRHKIKAFVVKIDSDQKWGYLI